MNVQSFPNLWKYHRNPADADSESGIALCKEQQKLMGVLSDDPSVSN